MMPKAAIRLNDKFDNFSLFASAIKWYTAVLPMTD